MHNPTANTTKLAFKIWNRFLHSCYAIAGILGGYLLVQPQICMIQVCMILWLIGLGLSFKCLFIAHQVEIWTLNRLEIAIFSMLWGVIPIAEMRHHAAKNEQQW